MHYAKLIEVNKKVLDKAQEEVEKARVVGKYECEDMEALSMAIKNIYYLTKLEKMEGGYVSESKERKMDKEYSRKAKENESEFCTIVYGMIEEGADKIDGIITLFDEHMDDLKVIHPKMYENLMVRLKGMR